MSADELSTGLTKTLIATQMLVRDRLNGISKVLCLFTALHFLLESKGSLQARE